jgi:hypothetical protein
MRLCVFQNRRSMTIHQKAEDMVRRSHGEMTLAEAYRELGRRGRQSRRYGKTKVVADKNLNAIEPPAMWWNKD